MRWKALLFGGIPLALGLLTIWVAVEAFDPAWTAHVVKGQYLVDSPRWIRVPVFLATAVLLVLMGIWMLWAGLTGAVVAVIDNHSVTARTIFGRRRQLPWSSVVAAKRKKNQLVLSPAGTDTPSQEIWDRRSVLPDVGMLDAASRDIEALVSRHRPDIVFRDVK